MFLYRTNKMVVFYPRKFTQKRCKRMEHTAKSAKARSGERPLKSGEFCALVWIRRLAANTKLPTVEMNPARNAL